MLNDFLSNLLAETLGIVVTVFLVDRLLKRREERLWLPSKHMVYRNLFEIFDYFLLKELGITPAADPVWFYFGSVKILGSGKFGDYNESRIRSIIKAIPPEKREAQVYTGAMPYLEARREVERILHTSARVLGPDLTTLLVAFNNSISIFVQSSHFEGETDYEALEQIWADIGMHAFYVRLYLEKSADRCVTLREDLNRSIAEFKGTGTAKRG
jgi:hypothetical protein